MKNMKLILDISTIISDIATTENPVQRVVSYLRDAVGSDVCSVYLLDRVKRDHLVLYATAGLAPDAVGKVRMPLDEGLTGVCFRSKEYLFISDAFKHPSFKYIPGIGEEPFLTYIGVPMMSGQNLFGVMVFQFATKKRNTVMLQHVLSAAAALVSGHIMRYSIMEQSFAEDEEYQEKEIRLNGVALSDGIAIGNPVRIINHFTETTTEQHDADTEMAELEKAFEATRNDLHTLIDRLQESGSSQYDIFHAHLLMLDDVSFRREIEMHITKYSKSAAFSVRHVSDKFISRFMAIQDIYLRERAADIEDIAQRLLLHLGAMVKHADLTENSIVMAERLTPGETASLNLDRVSGFVTIKDGITSHTAILAKSRGIPAVSGVHNLLEMSEFAHTVIIDGYEGCIIINPDDTTIIEYVEKQQTKLAAAPSHKPEPGPVITAAGEKICFLANVASVQDAVKAKDHLCDGIGLVRTEILYLQAGGIFDAEQHRKMYEEIAQVSDSDGDIIFRLLDIGADKKSAGESYEDNPALGFRGARLLIAREQMLCEQLRVLILLYQRFKNIKILVPFVTTPEELFSIRAVAKMVAHELNAELPPLGVMIEIPSNIFTIEELAKDADFFSVGSNDLFQYTYAVDRTNPNVSSLYHPDSNAFLAIMNEVFRRVSATGKPIEICGEIAADPTMLPKLIETGYRNFSINPYSIGNQRRLLLGKAK